MKQFALILASTCDLCYSRLLGWELVVASSGSAKQRKNKDERYYKECVKSRMRNKREIDREKKKKSTFDLTTDNGACLGCLPQISPFTLNVTTSKYLYSAAGNAKNIFENSYISSIIPRLTLLTKTFIQTCNHSYTVHFFKSFDTILFTSLEAFPSTSWTLSFSSWTLFFFLDLIYLFSGDRSLYLIYLPQFVGLHPTATTGLISGCACLGVPAIKSAAPMSPPPRVNFLVPVPVATYNTYSAQN